MAVLIHQILRNGLPQIEMCCVILRRSYTLRYVRRKLAWKGKEESTNDGAREKASGRSRYRLHRCANNSRHVPSMDNSDPVITCPIQNRCQGKRGKRGNVIENATGLARVGKTGDAIYYSDTRARCFYDPPYFLPWRLPKCWIRKIDSAKCCLAKTEEPRDTFDVRATPIIVCLIT